MPAEGHNQGVARSTRPISARARILAAILAVACVGLVIAGSVTFFVQREQVLADVDARLATQAQLLSTVATDAMRSDPGAEHPDAIDVHDFTTLSDYLEAVIERVTPARNEGSVAVIDGDVRFRPATVTGQNIADDEGLIADAIDKTRAADTTVTATYRSDGAMLRYIAVPVTIDGSDGEGLYIRAIDLDAELAPVTTAITTYIVAGLGVLAAIAIVGWFVAGRLLSPIRRLRETADSITLDDLSPRLAAEGNDDIADLSRTVNSMLDRLEGSVDVQRQLLDDVRHELKTPITIVRGHLEMMDPNDAADVETTREIGIAELDRMTRLVNDIDLLATVEGEAYSMESVDLAALTSRVGELVTVIPDHSWTVSVRADGEIIADPDRLLQAWLQLADNASKYTPPGSPIEIGSALDEAGARLWVCDHGPGIPPAFRHRIFRRFDRANGKRTVGGSGLGLAIVDAITKAHGGRCAVVDTPGGGATFVIQLPLPTTELPAPVRAGDVVLQREAAE